MIVNHCVLKYRPSQLDYDPSRTTLVDEVWKASSSTSDIYDDDDDDAGFSPIHRHYDNRYSHKRHSFVSEVIFNTRIRSRTVLVLALYENSLYSALCIVSLPQPVKHACN